MTIEQLREYRIVEFAIFDFVASYLGIYLISPILIWIFKKAKIQTDKSAWLFFVLPISVIVHIIFGRITPLTKLVISMNSGIIAKIIVGISTFFGFKHTSFKPEEKKIVINDISP